MVGVVVVGRGVEIVVGVVVVGLGVVPGVVPGLLPLQLKTEGPIKVSVVSHSSFSKGHGSDLEWCNW